MGDLLRDTERRIADITFDRQHLLDLGGVRVQLLVVGPTHTRGDTGFFVEGDGVLFSGDVVMNNSFLAANQESSITAWLAAFDAFEAMGPSTIVPAHGEVGDGSLIPTHRMVMRTIQARAHELKAQGRSAGDVAETVRTELEARHPTWGRINGVANARSGRVRGSTLATCSPSGAEPVVGMGPVASSSFFGRRARLVCTSPLQQRRGSTVTRKVF